MSPKIEPGAAPHYHADIINNAKETKRKKKIAAVQRKAKQPKSSKSFALEMAILPKRGKTRLEERRWRKTTMNWEGSQPVEPAKTGFRGKDITLCCCCWLLHVLFKIPKIILQ